MNKGSGAEKKNNKPAICVSIAAAEISGIAEEASRAKASPADMIEWRVDAFKDAEEPIALLAALKELREAAGDMPLMFTYRTEAEGGMGSDDPDIYEAVIRAAADSGAADIVDVQVISGAAASGNLIDYVHSKGASVIGSYHDFEGTPSVRSICECFDALKSSGADIIKIALMAESPDDTNRLLDAAGKTRLKYPDIRLVAIAMGDAGMASRIDAEKFGSCIIYAAGSKKTAPGQMDVYELVKAREDRKNKGND